MKLFPSVLGFDSLTCSTPAKTVESKRKQFCIISNAWKIIGVTFNG